MTATEVKTGTPPDVADAPASVAVTKPNEAPRAPMAASEVGAHSMQEILHLAIERGTPVEALEKILAMTKEIRADAARDAFHEALAQFQAECQPIFRAKKADFTTKGGGNVKYDFASLDDIARVINPILTKFGLSYTWDTTIDKNMLTVITIVRHRGGHSESTKFTLPIDSNASMGEQQKYGSALTFGQRRGLSAALGLVTTSEDPDSPKLDPTPISEDQATVINDLLTETRMPLSRFLKYFEAASVEKIRAVDYQSAVGLLEDRQKKVRA